MNLSADLKQFINDNLKKDINTLALKKNPFPDCEWSWILNQIQAKQKAEKKLPTWFANNDIVFPNTLSIEQTSSEALAKFKSELISGEKLIDLTGGFGVDAFYFAKRFKKVIHCEFQEDLSAIVQHNFNVLNVDNIEAISGDSITYLKKSTENFDWIYIDPARRDDKKTKVFLLKDCTPNIVELHDLLFEKSDNILIKVAPLLDISSILNELSNVKTIYAIGLQNEVKELLIVLQRDFIKEPELIAVNISNDGTFHQDTFPLNDAMDCQLSLPFNYLYEPFSSYLKIGVYNHLTIKFKVQKLHKHSHLYTSNELIDFPGRSFKIEQIIPYNKKEIKFLENTKCNITTRNFPLKVEEIRKKHKIKDGGDLYAFFTTDLKNDKIVVICKKITTDS
ncbi:class I SAM-dependent methyltransferase [Flavobacterium sp. CBA20B-1]|uniref:class I SAM-dependent methyltransferase n=1 Tax=unclassified Flavobacterium TaxID=196869 RepID=UPI0022240FC5|nr:MULTISPECIES: class I SAM-dependent methyltransferase [unclassified Flavobacterium]WCM42817.1 class I SAM-dependent methyltransferase [Flavobacterium sp. CBA20B-1]